MAKYIPSIALMAFGNEIVSLMALCIVSVLIGWDLMKARLER